MIVTTDPDGFTIRVTLDPNEAPPRLVDVMRLAGITHSNNEGRRLIEQGGITILTEPPGHILIPSDIAELCGLPKVRGRTYWLPIAVYERVCALPEIKVLLDKAKAKEAP